MLGYAVVGSNKLPEAKNFYVSLLARLEMTHMFDHPSGGALYGKDGALLFGVLGPFDGKPATVGNGMMIALKAPTRAAVDSIHSLALSLGGTTEGAPGVRGPNPEGPFYGAYFRDLDGNKLCVFHWQSESPPG
jgi:catechol 2,3-dioxygenase-like lactoylglutathione lyase family enzyme